MYRVTRCTYAVGMSPTLGRIRATRDPLTRARAAQTLIEHARHETGQAQTIRDQAIREAHRARLGTRAEIAKQVGVTVHVVVTALREGRDQ